MPETPDTAATGTVPFVDVHLGDGQLVTLILEDIARLTESAAFVNGPQVADFEAEFAAYCDTAHCVGVSSGLDALRLGLLAAGIEPGDEVIVPAQTFVATVEAVTQAGGIPVLADISETDYCLDPDAAGAAVTPRTRFLLPVHLYGQLADLRELEAVAKRQELSLLEDACQAHGAQREGRRAGSAGLAGAFSFYPTKNLGAFGDAGALVTDSPELAQHVRALREHGQTGKYRHDFEGYTARLDTIQALVLQHKLGHLDAWNEQRRDVAAYYLGRLAGLGDVGLPPVALDSLPVWHLFVVTTAEPDSLGAFLRGRGVGTGRHYPAPVHLTRAYRSLGYPVGAFPVAERLASTALSLPIFPGITEQQLEHVVAAVRIYFDGA